MIRSIADLQQMKETYLEKMGQYSHLCMVCYGTGCMSSGCKNVRDALVEELEKAGLTDKIAVIERGCMGTCAAVVAILSLVLYGAYRLTRRSVCRSLKIGWG